jgi:transposase
MDSTTLRAWSNGAKAKKSDRQAGWCVKLNTHGKTEFTYGWKLHLLVDTEYGRLPLAANVTAGNIHDSTRATNLLSEARFTMNHFKAKYIIADAGYSSDKLRRYVQREYGEPIFDAPKGHKKAYMRNSNNPKFLALKRLRGAVERTFSQLKRMHSLNRIRVRGRMKVSVHVYLSLITLQSATL